MSIHWKQYFNNLFCQSSSSHCQVARWVQIQANNDQSIKFSINCRDNICSKRIFDAFNDFFFKFKLFYRKLFSLLYRLFLKAQYFRLLSNHQPSHYYLQENFRRLVRLGKAMSMRSKVSQNTNFARFSLLIHDRKNSEELFAEHQFIEKHCDTIFLTWNI